MPKHNLLPIEFDTYESYDDCDISYEGVIFTDDFGPFKRGMAFGTLACRDHAWRDFAEQISNRNYRAR